MTSKHAILSPSSAHRWLWCPGSVVLERGEPNTSSSYADEGTAAHFLLEQCLIESKHPKEHEGRFISVGAEGANWVIGMQAFHDAPARYHVNDEMVDLIGNVYENILARVENFKNLGAHEVEVRPETKVSIEYLTGEEGATGTADVIILAHFKDGTVLSVEDLKYGRGVEVQAEKNEQLAMYGLGVRNELGLIYDITEMHLVIHQPKVSRTPITWQPTNEHLARFEYEVQRRAETCMVLIKGVAPAFSDHFNPTEKGCKFCKAKAKCPALRSHVLSTVADDFVDLTKDVKPQIEPAAERVEHSDDAILDSLFPALDLIEDWVKAVRAKIEARALAGATFRNCKLVEGRKGARKWGDAAEVEATMKSMRLKLEEMYDLSLISPTSAEKLAKAGTIGPRQWPRLQGLITQTEGKPSVAPMSDKRPPLVVTPVADDFDVVVEDLV